MLLKSLSTIALVLLGTTSATLLEGRTLQISCVSEQKNNPCFKNTSNPKYRQIQAMMESALYALEEDGVGHPPEDNNTRKLRGAGSERNEERELYMDAYCYTECQPNGRYNPPMCGMKHSLDWLNRAASCRLGR